MVIFNRDHGLFLACNIMTTRLQLYYIYKLMINKTLKKEHSLKKSLCKDYIN